MAGTFTRATFYKLATSPDARIEYTGVYNATSPYSYRIVDRSPVSGAINYQGGANLIYGNVSSVFRTISPAANLSPTWPRTAGASVKIFIQENVAGAGYLSPATGEAFVTAITNPAVSGTQTFATTVAATISHTPALSTSGAGGTLEYNFTASPPVYTSSGWTTGALTLTRGDRVYLWARRGVGTSDREDFFSVYNGPFDVPYLSPNLAVGTVTVGATELTGSDVSDVSVSWTNQTNHQYRITRTDTSTNVRNNVSTGSTTILYSPAGDLPLQGEVVPYKMYVRRTTAGGGDNVYYDATGTNVEFEILRIKEPTVRDTQNFNLSSPTPITHTIDLKADGLGGTLQYGWNTTGSPQQSAVTNWQSSATFTNAFTRGNTYYFYARRSTDAADFDVSAAQLIPPQAEYGLKVWDSGGTKTVFDPSFRPANLITCKISGTEVTSVTLTAGATSSNITAPGVTSTNGTEVFIFAWIPGYVITTGFSITRATDYFTITSNAASTQTVYFFVGRYI